MKKFIMLALLTLSILTSSAFGSVDPYEDWDWVNGTWVYTGTDPDPIPPPQPPLEG